MNFIKQLINTYNKGLEFDEVQKALDIAIELNNELRDSNLGLRSDLQVALVRIEELEKELADTKKISSDTEKVFTTEELVKALKSKIRPDPYEYPFKGDGRPYDIKYSLIYKDKEIVYKYANEIQSIYKPTTPLECIEAVTKYFIFVKKPRYVKDGAIDIWEPADEFLKTFKGDCDTTAITMHVLIRELLIMNGLEEYYPRLFLHIQENYLEGHANNIWLHDDGSFYTIESTIDVSGTYSRKWLKVPLENDSFYKRCLGIANLLGSHKGSRNVYRKHTPV
jgi:hypothetical protein